MLREDGLMNGRPGWSWRSTGLAVMLAALVVGAFFPALVADFVSFDDPKFVTENARIRALSGDNLWWMLTENSGGHWHPLTWLSWAIDYRIAGGLKPLVFHVTNVGLHAINAVLVFAIARWVLWMAWVRSGGGALDEERAEFSGLHGRGLETEAATHPQPPPSGRGLQSGANHHQLAASGRGLSAVGLEVAAFFAAALFAVHPLRVESVAWVTERRDVLSAVFLLGAVLAYGRSVRAGQVAVASWAWTAATCGLLALSLMAKAWGMSFFVIALILDWYPLGRLPRSVMGWWSRDVLRVVVQKTPLVVLGVGAAALAAWAQRSALATKTLDEWGVMERAVQVVYGLWFYTFKTVAPTDLCVMYELPIPLEPGQPRFVWAYLGVAISAAVVIALWRRWAGLVAAAAVYGVMLAPVLGILQSGEQFVADRYSYLACIPMGMVLAWGAVELWRRKAEVSAGLLGVVGGVVVVVLGLLTFAQSTTWQNGLTLWEQAYRVSPTPLVRLNYGQELYNVDRKEESVAVLEALVADAPGEGRAWFLLAEHYRDVGQIAKAETAFRRAGETMPQAYMAHVNLGYLLLGQRGREAEAITSLRAAVADVEKGGRRVLHPGAYMALGDGLRRTGDVDGARAAFGKALEYDETRAMAEKELRRLGK